MKLTPNSEKNPGHWWLSGQPWDCLKALLFPYLFVPSTNFQPPAPGGTKLTSVLCKGTVSFPALGFLQVWESDTSQKDKAVKNIFEKDKTSKGAEGEGRVEQAPSKGHWEEGWTVLTSKRFQGPDTELDNGFFPEGAKLLLSLGSCEIKATRGG